MAKTVMHGDEGRYKALVKSRIGAAQGDPRLKIDVLWGNGEIDLFVERLDGTIVEVHVLSRPG